MDANLSMEQIRKDVKNVTELNQGGYDMDVISHKLDLSKDYVQTILTCAQGLQKTTHWLWLYWLKQVYKFYQLMIRNLSLTVCKTHRYYLTLPN